MKTISKMHKRGFFFTVMALAILSVMLLTMQLWLATYGQSDIRGASRFKGEAMRLVLSSISDKSMSDFANASAFFAVYRLANYTSTSPLHGLAGAPQKYGTDNKGVGIVEDSLRSLMFNGTAKPDAILEGITYTAQENSSYTLRSWQEKVRTAANAMGFSASFSDIKNFSIYQPDPWTIKTHFEMDMNISDIEGTMRQSKTLKGDASFPISGFIDPSITRGDMEHRGIVRSAASEKQIFQNQRYSVPSDLKPIRILNGSKGFGWFFGPTTEDYPGEGIFDPGIANSESPYISQYILVTDFEDNLPAVASAYGAVILTEDPGTTTYNITEGGCSFNVTQETRCLNCIRSYSSEQAGCSKQSDVHPDNRTSKPFIVSSSILGNAVEATYLEPRPRISKYYALIDNSKDNVENPTPSDLLGDYHRVYDLTALRDATTCGFYVKGNGPSFFQRMLREAFVPGLYNNSVLGIETFVVGQWAGGKEDLQRDIYDAYPRLDRDFYTQGPAPIPQQVMKIKGMPGCRDKIMCADSNENATKEGLGKFKLHVDSIGQYGLSAISCNASNTFQSPCG
ncbi:MAG: hypothetical protein QW568_01380 [Candidatus Anstonellaceae archaeon]